MSPRGKPYALRLLLSCAGATVASLALMAGGAGAAAPIEGTWNFGDGQVLVTPNRDGGFNGVVSKAIKFADCDHPKGQRMWRLNGSGTAYTGTHVWYDAAPACEPAPGGPSRWDILDQSADHYSLRFCTTRPNRAAPEINADGTAKPGTVCMILTRAKPPAQPSTGGAGSAATSTSPGGSDACRGGLCVHIDRDAADAAAAQGCVPAGTVKHTFKVATSKRVSKRYKVSSVAFYLDGKKIGTARKAPFSVNIDKSKLTPGTHVVQAKAKLRNRKTRKLKRQTLTFRFKVCA